MSTYQELCELLQRAQQHHDDRRELASRLALELFRFLATAWGIPLEDDRILRFYHPQHPDGPASIWSAVVPKDGANALCYSITLTPPGTHREYEIVFDMLFTAVRGAEYLVVAYEGARPINVRVGDDSAYAEIQAVIAEQLRTHLTSEALNLNEPPALAN